MLISNLETFVHDPILDFSKKKTKTTGVSNCSFEETEAIKCLSAVGKKLKGYIDEGLPLSVEGQVEEFVRQAIDIGNLSQMFIGWAAYL